jgi:hypothetical protein
MIRGLGGSNQGGSLEYKSSRKNKWRKDKVWIICN